MKKKIGRLLRRSKSKPDLHNISSTSSNDKPYAECVVNRSALALDERQDVESRASGSDSQRMGVPVLTPGTQTTMMASNLSGGSATPVSSHGMHGIGPAAHHPSASYGSSSSNYGSGYSVGANSNMTGMSNVSNADQHSAFDARKLVIQYFLQDAESTYDDDGRRKNLGAGMAVKVKARVESAPLSLEENIHIQIEEDKRAARSDNRYQPRLGGFVHCVAPQSSNIDASDAIGLVSNYVVAYRALHRTCDRPLRRHDKVLITNAHGSLGRALVELTLLGGASVVFGTSPPKYHDRLSKWGATPLDSDNNEEWSELLLGSVDVVIDTDAGNACPAAPLVANQGTGKLVRILTGPNAGGDVKIWRKKNSLMDQPISTTFYDVFHDMESDPANFRLDLQLLFDMMYKGSIQPKKKKAIPLLGVSYIELRFDRTTEQRAQQHAEGASVGSKQSRSKSVGSHRSSSRGSRSQSNPRSRHQMDSIEQTARERLGGDIARKVIDAERRSKSAPRASNREWDDAADEIARKSFGKLSKSRSSGSSKRSTSAPRQRREEDDISKRTRQRMAEDEYRTHNRSSSSSSRSRQSSKEVRSRSAPRQREGGELDRKEQRSLSAPRTRVEDDISWSSRRKMKSGRTDRSKSAPRERWNDENDGGIGNDRYGKGDSQSVKGRETKTAARVFDFSFW